MHTVFSYKNYQRVNGAKLTFNFKSPGNRYLGISSKISEKEARFNPFVPNPPFLYLLKTSENLTVEMSLTGRNGLI